jgi:uncharacterized protein involved in outer membrane biogenesis
MKKWIFIGLAAGVVIVAVVLFVGLSNLGPIIKKAVNTYGPEITGTETHVADVSVSILSAEAKINDFFLGNPKGFKTPSAVQVDSVFVNVDEKTLVGNPIIIDQIKVKSPQISYEKKGKIDNFQSILDHVNKATAFEKSATTSSKDKRSEKKLIVRDFIITNGSVNVSLAIYGLGQKEIIVSLPDIHLKDIGKEGNGLSAAEVSKKIFAALYGKITSNAVTNVINQELKAHGANLDSLGKTTMKQVEDASEKAKDLGEKVKGLLNN